MTRAQASGAGARGAWGAQAGRPAGRERQAGSHRARRRARAERAGGRCRHAARAWQAGGAGARGALAGQQAHGHAERAWHRSWACDLGAQAGQGCALGALGLFLARFDSVLFMSQFLDIVCEPGS